MPREICEDCHDVLNGMEDDEKAEFVGCLLSEVSYNTRSIRLFAKSLETWQLVELADELDHIRTMRWDAEVNRET